MATDPIPSDPADPSPAPGDAEGVFNVPGVTSGPTMPPQAPEPARVTLTIDLGTLTPDTVKAIKDFVQALSNDPAKGAGSGPKPGSKWEQTQS